MGSDQASKKAHLSSVPSVKPVHLPQVAQAISSWSSTLTHSAPPLGQPAPVFKYFFDLPPELREKILWLVCVYPGGFHVGTMDAPVDLFLANQQMYQEASAVFYAQNVFCAQLPPRRLRRGREDATDSLLCSAPARPARMRIRTLELSISRCGDHLANHVVPRLREMVLAGALRELKVLQTGLGGWFDPSKGVGPARPSRPFAALLRLLADPDLRRVALRFWSGGRKQNGTYAVDVDLTEMLSRLGDGDEELRILKIGD